MRAHALQGVARPPLFTDIMPPSVSAGAARAPLRVLVVHNRYQQAGGEDAVVRDEIRMLRDRGLMVETYERSNDQVAELSLPRLAAGTVYSRRTNDDVRTLIRLWRPDVIHAHNTFPLISPSLYFAANAHGVPVVQTLHNFRLFCAQAMFLREGKVCEDCMGSLPWRGIVHRCYRNSAAQSAALVGMLGVHRLLGTYQNRVARYIALNRFCRDKFVQAGLPAARVAVKPNFVDLPRPDARAPRAGALFVGRLSGEKGISTLAQAARQMQSAAIDVIGDGPQEDLLRGIGGVRLLGRQAPDDIYERMRGAACLVLPSVWYENFPRVLVEAFACGLPVIASRLGAMADLVEEGVTGLLFEPGNAAELAQRLQWARENPERMRRMGTQAREQYERKYTPEVNFSQLLAIYHGVLKVPGQPRR